MAAANTTEAVVGRHIQVLLSRDLDGVMKDYTQDSVFFTPNGVAKGLENIRAVFEGLLSTFPPELTANFKVIKQDINGEYAYHLWSMLPAVKLGSDTFHIHNGKIVMQSSVFQPGA
jgi:ketosteroid isomerase-like protein